jgi:hypothetical protein
MLKQALLVIDMQVGLFFSGFTGLPSAEHHTRER